MEGIWIAFMVPGLHDLMSLAGISFMSGVFFHFMAFEDWLYVLLPMLAVQCFNRSISFALYFSALSQIFGLLCIFLRTWSIWLKAMPSRDANVLLWMCGLHVVFIIKFLLLAKSMSRCHMRPHVGYLVIIPIHFLNPRLDLTAWDLFRNLTFQSRVVVVIRLLGRFRGFNPVRGRSSCLCRWCFVFRWMTSCTPYPQPAGSDQLLYTSLTKSCDAVW